MSKQKGDIMGRFKVNALRASRIKKKGTLSPLNCLLLWIAAFIIVSVGVHYLVCFLFWFGDKFFSLPTFLNEKEILTYLISVLSTITSATISLIALYQTYRANSARDFPTIIISNGNNPFFEIVDNINTENSVEIVKVSCANDRSDIKLILRVLDKSIKSLSVDEFLVFSESGENITKFDSVTLPSIAELRGYIPANHSICISYGTEEIKLGFNGIASFRIKCKTIFDESFQKYCEARFALTNDRVIIIHDISDGYWKKVRN